MGTINSFISKTKMPIHMVDKSVLQQCYTGLKRRIKRTANNAQKYRLKVIADEIRFLINNL